MYRNCWKCYPCQQHIPTYLDICTEYTSLKECHEYCCLKLKLCHMELSSYLSHKLTFTHECMFYSITNSTCLWYDWYSLVYHLNLVSALDCNPTRSALIMTSVSAFKPRANVYLWSSSHKISVYHMTFLYNRMVMNKWMNECINEFWMNAKFINEFWMNEWMNEIMAHTILHNTPILVICILYKITSESIIKVTDVSVMQSTYHLHVHVPVENWMMSYPWLHFTCTSNHTL